jgi:hypothetical protein
VSTDPPDQENSAFRRRIEAYLPPSAEPAHSDAPDDQASAPTVPSHAVPSHEAQEAVERALDSLEASVSEPLAGTAREAGTEEPRMPDAPPSEESVSEPDVALAFAFAAPPPWADDDPEPRPLRLPGSISGVPIPWWGILYWFSVGSAGAAAFLLTSSAYVAAVAALAASAAAIVVELLALERKPRHESRWSASY